MAHDSSYQPDPELSDTTPQTGTLRSGGILSGQVEGADLVDESTAARGTAGSPEGTAGVVLGVAGLPDRESLQESGDTGASDLGAALQRESGLGGTRGDDRSFSTPRGEITGAGGTRGSGPGTGRSGDTTST
jgi:hypothetical protein